MGEIRAPTGEILGVGGDVAALAPSAGALGAAGRSIGAAAAQPPLTSAALQDLGAELGPGLQRLQQELAGLGHAAQASAIAYSKTDESAMNGA